MQSDETSCTCTILISVLTISAHFKVYTTIVRNVNSKTTYQRELEVSNLNNARRKNLTILQNYMPLFLEDSSKKNPHMLAESQCVKHNRIQISTTFINSQYIKHVVSRMYLHRRGCDCKGCASHVDKSYTNLAVAKSQVLQLKRLCKEQN